MSLFSSMFGTPGSRTVKRFRKRLRKKHGRQKGDKVFAAGGGQEALFYAKRGTKPYDQRRIRT